PTARYRRMFPDLPPFHGDVGRFLAAAQSSEDRDTPARQQQSNDANGSEAAGWPFFGQFVAHDLTANRSPLVGLPPGAPRPAARSPGTISGSWWKTFCHG